jgi:drug/metabolite transporter (DMT)-like permease
VSISPAQEILMAAELPRRARQTPWPIKLLRFFLAGVFTVAGVVCIVAAPILLIMAGLSQALAGQNTPEPISYWVGIVAAGVGASLIAAAIWTR